MRGDGAQFFEETVTEDTGEENILKNGLPAFSYDAGLGTDTWQTPTAKSVKDLLCLLFFFLWLPLGRVNAVCGRRTGC